MPKPYPSEFRDDVVRVARIREPGVTIEKIAREFGVHSMTLTKWRCSSGSRDPATRPAVTPRSATSAPWSSRDFAHRRIRGVINR